MVQGGIMLKKILIALVAVLVIAVIVGLLLPRQVKVERAVVIDRPASLIFATVNSFQLFPRWSPWQDLDPNMHQTVEGPREGVGAKLIWTGNDKVGNGTQIITAATPDRSVASDLDFGSMGTAKSVMTLTPQGTSTKVAWSVLVDMGANPVGHYFGLMMDGMLGKDFATGLGKLKTLMESMPNQDIAGFTADEVQLESKPLLLVTETVEQNPAAIGRAYADGFGKIGKVMAKNKWSQAGAPLGIERDAAAQVYSFDAGIPVAAGSGGSLPAETPANADSVKLGQSYGGKALKTTHVGDYAALGKTYAKLAAYMAAHGYVAKGPAISWFVDDPGTIPMEKVRTEVYLPTG
jgi:effector-binding domain-containing protein